MPGVSMPRTLRPASGSPPGWHPYLAAGSWRQVGWPLSAGLQPTMAELRETEEGDPLYPKRRMKDWDRSWDREPLAVVKVATEEQVPLPRLFSIPPTTRRSLKLVFKQQFFPQDIKVRVCTPSSDPCRKTLGPQGCPAVGSRE